MGPFKSTRYTNTIYDKFPYTLIGYSTSSYNTNGYDIGTKLIGEATHSDFATYVTEIGLYNDNSELLAVAKLSKPLLKSYSREAIIKVKLDF